MRNDALIASVDRIEGAIAILEADDGRLFEVPLKRFMEKPAEGMIYRVPAGRQLQWSKAVRDREEEARRKAELGKRIDKLAERDPGGDVTL